MTNKPKRGRKPTGKTPVRQVGRIRNENWKIIRRGFNVSGEKRLTAWAEKVLIDNAENEIRKFKLSNQELVKLARRLSSSSYSTARSV